MITNSFLSDSRESSDTSLENELHLLSFACCVTTYTEMPPKNTQGLNVTAIRIREKGGDAGQPGHCHITQPGTCTSNDAKLMVFEGVSKSLINILLLYIFSRIHSGILG